MKGAGIRAQVEAKRKTDERASKSKQIAENSHKGNNRGISEEQLIGAQERASKFWQGVGACLHANRNELQADVITQAREISVAVKERERKILEDMKKEETSLSYLSKVINPASMHKIEWDFFMGAIIFYSIVTLPYRITFDVISTCGWVYSDYVIDGFFWADMLASFNTGYYDTNDKLVMDRLSIAKQYTKWNGWFWIDLVSTFPIDRVVESALGTGDVDDQCASTASGVALKSLRLVRTIRLIKLVKLARYMKLGKVSEHMESWNISPAYLNVMKLVLQLFFVAHLIACFWYYLTRPDIAGETDWNADEGMWMNWINYYGYGGPEYTAYDRYVASLYWTVATMLAVGYGDIAATNMAERVYAIVTMIAGGIMFGAIIAQVTRLIESRNPQAKAMKSKMDELKAYLAEKILPKRLKKKAKESYQYYFNRRSTLAESGLLEDLPSHMLIKLVHNIYYREIQRINLFKQQEDAFVQQLLLHSKPYQIPPGDIVFKTFDVAEEVSFIMIGLVRICVNDGIRNAVIGYASEGGYFGDFEFYKKCNRLADYQAVHSCNVLTVSNEVLDSAIFENVDAGIVFGKGLKKRYELFLYITRLPSKKAEHDLYLKPSMWVDGSLKLNADGAGLESISTKKTTRPFRVLKVDEDGEYEIVEETPVEIGERNIVYHQGPAKLRWDGLVGCLIMYSVPLVPVQIGFNRYAKYCGFWPCEPVAVVDFIVDIFFGADLIISCRTSYFDEEEDALITAPKMIFYHYFVGWFWVDFLSVFPFDLVISAAMGAATGDSASGEEDGESAVFSFTKLIKVARLLRLLKVVRLAKLSKYLIQLEDMIGVNPVTFDLLKMTMDVVFIGHMLACLWWYLTDGVISSRSESWAAESLVDLLPPDGGNAPLNQQYVASLYWSFTTLTTTGYGDITPTNTSQRLTVIFIMMLGATVFGYIVANVSTLMSGLNQTSARISERISEITEFLIEKNCPSNLSMAIVRHFRHMFKESSAFDEKSILERLPGHLSLQILIIQHSSTLTKIPILKEIENDSVAIFIFKRMNSLYFDTDQSLLEEGEFGTDIFFILSGTVKVYKAKSPDQLLRDRGIRAKQVREEEILTAQQRGVNKRRKSVVDMISKSSSELNAPLPTYQEETQIPIGELKVGDFVGHMSLMDGVRNKATVRAVTACGVYALNKIAIERILTDYPSVGLMLQVAFGRAIHKQTLTIEQKKANQIRAKFTNAFRKEFREKKRESGRRSQRHRSVSQLFRDGSDAMLASPVKGVGSLLKRASSTFFSESSQEDDMVNFKRKPQPSEYQQSSLLRRFSTSDLKNSKSFAASRNVRHTPGSRPHSTKSYRPSLLVKPQPRQLNTPEQSKRARERWAKVRGAIRDARAAAMSAAISEIKSGEKQKDIMSHFATAMEKQLGEQFNFATGDGDNLEEKKKRHISLHSRNNSFHNLIMPKFATGDSHIIKGVPRARRQTFPSLDIDEWRQVNTDLFVI